MPPFDVEFAILAVAKQKYAVESKSINCHSCQSMVSLEHAHMQCLSFELYCQQENKEIKKHPLASIALNIED